MPEKQIFTTKLTNIWVSGYALRTKEKTIPFSDFIYKINWYRTY